MSIHVLDLWNLNSSLAGVHNRDMHLLLDWNLHFLVNPLHLRDFDSVLLHLHLRHMSVLLHGHLDLLVDVLHLWHLHVLLDGGDLWNHDLLLDRHLDHVVHVLDLWDLYRLLHHIYHGHVSVSDLGKLDFLIHVLHNRHLDLFLDHHGLRYLYDLLNRNLDHLVNPLDLRHLHLVWLHGLGWRLLGSQALHGLCHGRREGHGFGLRRRCHLRHWLRHSLRRLRDLGDDHDLLVDHGLLSLDGLVHDRWLLHLHYLQLILDNSVHHGVRDFRYLDDLLLNGNLWNLHHLDHDLGLRDLHNHFDRILNNSLLFVDDGDVDDLLHARLDWDVDPFLNVKVRYSFLLHHLRHVHDLFLVDGDWHLNHLLNLGLEEPALLNYLWNVHRLHLLLNYWDIHDLLHMHLALACRRLHHWHMDYLLLGNWNWHFHHLFHLIHDSSLPLLDDLRHLHDLYLLLMHRNVHDLLHRHLLLPSGCDDFWHMHDFLLNNWNRYFHHLFHLLVDNPLLGDDDRLLHDWLAWLGALLVRYRIQEDWRCHHHEDWRGLHHLPNDGRRHRGRRLGQHRRLHWLCGSIQQGRCRCCCWRRCWCWRRCDWRWCGRRHRRRLHGDRRQGHLRCWSWLRRSRAWQVDELPVLSDLLESLDDLDLRNFLLRDDLLNGRYLHNVLRQLARNKVLLHHSDLLRSHINFRCRSRDIHGLRFLLRHHRSRVDSLNVGVRSTFAWNLDLLRVYLSLDRVHALLAADGIPSARKHRLEGTDVQLCVRWCRHCERRISLGLHSHSPLKLLTRDHSIVVGIDAAEEIRCRCCRFRQHL
mmetsp:Transcript_31713/g.75631  ORF Transcript_31713/g.75631 Transcript_31713/m.75631 type:complete len:807 (-) Transcript_31713:106-2526(-)